MCVEYDMTATRDGIWREAEDVCVCTGGKGEMRAKDRASASVRGTLVMQPFSELASNVGGSKLFFKVSAAFLSDIDLNPSLRHQ